MKTDGGGPKVLENVLKSHFSRMIIAVVFIILVIIIILIVPGDCTSHCGRGKTGCSSVQVQTGTIIIIIPPSSLLGGQPRLGKERKGGKVASWLFQGEFIFAEIFEFVLHICGNIYLLHIYRTLSLVHIFEKYWFGAYLQKLIFGADL